ncbi:MAG: hypothetical protein ACI9CA_000580 [Natronomonas sp.]|jgi:hypothetical protein
MPRVCLLGAADITLRYELLSRETAREALATYDLAAPYANTVAVETVSLGTAVALCNDLNWYLVRFARDAFVEDRSVSETEWLSRALAAAVRDGGVDPGETGRYLRVYGVEGQAEGPPELRDPMYVARTGETVPEYDLHEVDDTLRVRVTEAEFEA